MEFKECPDVRLAVPEDIPDIIRLFREHLIENNEADYDREKVLSIIGLHFNKNGGIIGVIGDKGQELHGHICMVIQQNWYNTEYQLHELCLFVAKDYRKSTYAKQLMKFAKNAAEVLGLELRIGVWSSVRTEAKINLYKRQFKLKGAFFSHNERPKV